MSGAMSRAHSRSSSWAIDFGGSGKAGHVRYGQDRRPEKRDSSGERARTMGVPQELRERLVIGGFLEQPHSRHAAIRDAKNHPARSERCCSAQPRSKIPIREYRTCPTFFATGVNALAAVIHCIWSNEL